MGRDKKKDPLLKKGKELKSSRRLSLVEDSRNLRKKGELGGGFCFCRGKNGINMIGAIP
jgi:hypothetical protein